MCGRFGKPPFASLDARQITLEKPPFKVTPASVLGPAQDPQGMVLSLEPAQAAPELHAESDERYVHLEDREP